MSLREILRAMLRAFFVITTGATFGMFVFCLIFRPDAAFTLKDIRGIFLVAITSDLTFFVFYSSKELNKMQMLVRYVIHMLLVLSVLLFFAYILDWVSFSSAREIAVFVLLVFSIYALVFTATIYYDNRTAKKLRDGLNKRYYS